MVIASLFLMVDGYRHEMLFLKYHKQKYLIVRVILATETYETAFKKPLMLLIIIYQ